MSDFPITVGPRIDRIPVHATIDPEQISALVDQFYAKVRADERLGYLFAKGMEKEWPEHLERMKAFWRPVLLKTGEYKGKPVPAHMKLEEITTEDFCQWLRLFEETAASLMDPDAVPLVLKTAERIASSLWLARNPDPFSTVPVWSEHRRSQGL
ncbi:MAG: group III truncated hemoglobin [Pseudomonadota bacterium]